MQGPRVLTFIQLYNMDWHQNTVPDGLARDSLEAIVTLEEQGSGEEVSSFEVCQQGPVNPREWRGIDWSLREGSGVCKWFYWGLYLIWEPMSEKGFLRGTVCFIRGLTGEIVDKRQGIF
jgi:hypothetical protein